MSKTMKFRNAVPGDEGLILTFIRELADYEGMLDQVVADEKTLHTWIFEKEKAEVLFVLEGEQEELRDCLHTFHPNLSLPLSERVLSPRQALFAPTKEVAWDQAEGEVCAQQLAPYPPGIPVVAPGEKVDKKHLAYLAQIGYNTKYIKVVHR